MKKLTMNLVFEVEDKEGSISISAGAAKPEVEGCDVKSVSEFMQTCDKETVIAYTIGMRLFEASKDLFGEKFSGLVDKAALEGARVADMIAVSRDGASAIAELIAKKLREEDAKEKPETGTGKAD